MKRGGVVFSLLLNGAYRLHLGTHFILASFLELLFPKHCSLKVIWGYTATPSYGSRTILIQQRLSRTWAAKQSKRTRCHCSAGMSGLNTVLLNQGSNAFPCRSFTSFALHFDVCCLSISISDSIRSSQLLWISVLLSCFLLFSSIPAVNSSVALPNQVTNKTQACETCRNRKQRCDEQRPKCGTCQRFKLDCRYREPQPTKYVTTGA